MTEKMLQDIYTYVYLYAYSYAKTMLALKGGEGSGNFGHAGRPGLVGGSSSGGVTVYHGTVDQFKDNIIKNGILSSRASSVSKKGHVYATSDIESAKYWAENKVDDLGLDRTKTKLFVFEIIIPADVLARDVQSQGSNDYQIKGDIPAEWIVGVQEVDYYKSKKQQKILVPVLFINGKMYL